MSQTWYRANLGMASIVKMDNVVRSSEYFLYFETSTTQGGGLRREAKFTDYDQCFPTWREAHAALKQNASLRVQAAQQSLNVALSTLADVERLKDPYEEKEPVIRG